MQHRSEEILNAIACICEDLSTTGANVVRARVYDVDTAGTPALTISKGDDLVVEGSDGNTSFIDRMLDVEIVSHVKSNTTLDTSLSVIESEVFLAIMSDRQLGLSFVHNTSFVGALKPEIEVLEKGVAQQIMGYQVHYRHSLTSPTS